MRAYSLKSTNKKMAPQTKLKSFLFSISRGEVLLPHLRNFLLKEMREINAGRLTSADGVKKDADLTVACFTARKAEYNHRGNGDSDTASYFHPSQIGSCPRRLWFAAVGAPSSAAQATGGDLLKTHLVFEIGTYAHVLFQNLCARAGVLVRREIPVRSDKHKIIGHADGHLRIAPEGDCLLEFKTINVRGFTKLSGAKPEHRAQATVYMALLNLPQALIVYFNKDTQELKEFRVSFDRREWEEEILPKINRFHLSVKQKKMPPPLVDANPNKFPCLYCEFSRVCFDTFSHAKLLKTIGGKK